MSYPQQNPPVSVANVAASYPTEAQIRDYNMNNPSYPPQMYPNNTNQPVNPPQPYNYPYPPPAPSYEPERSAYHPEYNQPSYPPPPQPNPYAPPPSYTAPPPVNYLPVQQNYTSYPPQPSGYANPPPGYANPPPTTVPYYPRGNETICCPSCQERLYAPENAELFRCPCGQILRNPLYKAPATVISQSKSYPNEKTKKSLNAVGIGVGVGAAVLGAFLARNR